MTREKISLGRKRYARVLWACQSAAPELRSRSSNEDRKNASQDIAALLRSDEELSKSDREFIAQLILGDLAYRSRLTLTDEELERHWNEDVAVARLYNRTNLSRAQCCSQVAERLGLSEDRQHDLHQRWEKGRCFRQR